MTSTIENKKTLFVEINVKNNSYMLDECHYDVNFPLHYALSHLEGTGPKKCGNCYAYGSWRGVFIGYCVNCASYYYDYTRGNGFLGNGIEKSSPQGVSVFDTYLKGVSLACIGNYVEGGNPEHVLDNNMTPIMFDNVYDNIIKYIDYRGYILGLGMDYNCLPEDFSYALKTGDFSNYFAKVPDNYDQLHETNYYHYAEYEDEDEDKDEDKDEDEDEDKDKDEDEDYSDLPDLIPCDDENRGRYVRCYYGGDAGFLNEEYEEVN